MQPERKGEHNMGKQEREKRFFDTQEVTDVTILYGNRRVVVRGCRKILSYAPDEIKIALGKRVVRLTGKRLQCISFAAGSSTVEGIIRSVALEDLPKREGHQ